MKIINVNASSDYNVYIEKSLLNNVADDICKKLDFSTVCVVTDSNVASLYLEKLLDGFKIKNKKTLSYVIEAGEQSKNLEVFASICSFLAKNDFKRTDLIVALGGGVVGDLAGFVASAYHRGVAFAQVPTTLLACIDSSIGGKTAVDIPEGKNLVGAFYQPIAVYLDTNLLSTLPEKEFVNGYGELLKYAVLSGNELWQELTSDNYDLDSVIEKCVRYKIEVVKQDEKDNGIRALLNLGHTLAHSVENLSGYTVSHGVAVGYGLLKVARACVKHLNSDANDYEKIVALARKLKLDYVTPFSIDELVKEAFRDKKSFGDSINLVVIESIGKCKIQKFKLNELKDFFDD